MNSKHMKQLKSYPFLRTDDSIDICYIVFSFTTHLLHHQLCTTTYFLNSNQTQYVE